MATMPEMPDRIAGLPRTAAGLPVPYFVGYVDGKPDFRVADPRKFAGAIRHKLCWICGGGLGQHMAFVIGPMCTVNRVSSEPPAHYDCAEYALRACPFLTRPHAVRREANMPEGVTMAGIGHGRNPGVMALWVTRSYTLMPVFNGTLLELGEPKRIEWWTEGRFATPAEAATALHDGLPFLLDVAKGEGTASVLDLGKRYAEARALLPRSDPSEECQHQQHDDNQTKRAE
jgi:hypothetical protein